MCFESSGKWRPLCVLLDGSIAQCVRECLKSCCLVLSAVADLLVLQRGAAHPCLCTSSGLRGAFSPNTNVNHT